MNIIVNGGTRGIGKEVVLKLAKDPESKVLVTGRNLQVLKELSHIYSNVEYSVLDLSVINNNKVFINTVLSHFKRVDVLINMAGMLVAEKFMDISESDARMMMETNFFGPASIIRALKPLMASGSHIVNISSMGGVQGSSKYEGLSYYSASKAAIACLSECLATEFIESGIRVNCLALGSVQTQMLEEAFPGYKAPVTAEQMADFIADFALKGHRFFNGKILPVAINNP
jgi:NAD(P)-dependent dehydrogenase (short-subunit alcohol dehydrogenase family)